MTHTESRDWGQPPLPSSVRSAGAVIADEGRLAGRPLHYGWPADEQEAFSEGRGLAYLGSIGVVKVSGPDRLSWLSTMGSQIVSDLKPGDSKELLFLDAQGRIQFAAGVVDDGEFTFLITEPQFAARLTEFLKSMQFMLRVEVTDESERFVGFASANEDADRASKNRELATRLGGLTWQDPWPGVVEGGAAYFQGDHPGATLRVYVVPVQAADQFALDFKAGGDLKLVGLLAANAERVAAWRPLPGSEVDERALPAELDWLRTAVHLDKGCYAGQESVARIINLGRPPRRLTFLQLDGSGEGLPQPGTAIWLNGRQVGVLTSVANHFEMGPIGLGLVKRGLDPAAQLTVGGVDALQELIVPVDGRSDRSPDTRPGAGLKRLDFGKQDIRTRGPGTQR